MCADFKPRSGDRLQGVTFHSRVQASNGLTAHSGHVVDMAPEKGAQQWKSFATFESRVFKVNIHSVFQQ